MLDIQVLVKVTDEDRVLFVKCVLSNQCEKGM